MKNHIKIIFGIFIFALTVAACCKDPSGGGAPVFCRQFWVEINGDCECPEDYGRIYYEDVDRCVVIYPSRYYSDRTSSCACFTNYNFSIEQRGSSGLSIGVYERYTDSGGTYTSTAVGNPTEPLPDDSLSVRILARGIIPGFIDLDADNCFKDRGVELNHIDLTGRYHDRYMVMYLEYVFKDFTREYCQDTLWKLPR